MKRFLLLLLLVSFSGYSQYYISGKIVNEQNVAIEYAEVLLQTSDSILVKAEISDEKGEFLIAAIPKGNYILQIKNSSEIIYSTVLQLESDLNLKNIVVTESINLDEIVIQNTKPLFERKIDRIVFNVENSTMATGGNAFDALKLTPRIKIINDQISMIGKGGLKVMIDDRIVKFSGDQLADYLKSLSSDDLKSIEVIANPPAKYSAEGNSGLINIVTKKGRKDAWNAAVRATYKQTTYDAEGAGGSFNFQKNKLQVNSAFNFSNGSSAPQETSQVIYPNTIWKEESNRRDFTNGYSGSFGLEYKINTKISTGASYSFGSNDLTLVEIDKTDLYSVSTKALDSLIFTKARDLRAFKMNSLNYHIIYKIDTIGRKLSLDVDYFDFNNNNSRAFNSGIYFPNFQVINSNLETARSTGIQDIKNYSANLDMEHPTKWASLNYGGRISTVESNNISNYYDVIDNTEFLNETFSNQFKYKENTQAAYFSASKEFVSKWESKIGLRYEFTQTTGFSKTTNQSNEENYSKIFPTIYISYSANDNHTFSVDYSKRIGRPSYHFLNPFRIVSNPYVYTEGNPFLQPSFSDNVEFGYSYKDKFMTNISYYKISDGFFQVAINDIETNIQQIIPLNILASNTITFNSSYIFKPTKWFDLTTTLNVFYSEAHAIIPDTFEKVNGWTGNFSFLGDLTLNKSKTLFAGFYYNFDSRGVDELDRSTSSDILNLSLKYMLLDKKLVISLNGNDVFKSNRSFYTSSIKPVTMIYSNYYDQRYFRIGVQYNFGKSFKMTQRETKNQDEQNRAR